GFGDEVGSVYSPGINILAGAVFPFPRGGLSVFARLGRWCFRNRGKVVLLWLAALVVAGGASNLLGTSYSTEFGLPAGIESVEGIEILEEHFENDSLASVGSIVFYAEQGIDDPEVRAAIAEMLRSEERRVGKGGGLRR